MRELIKPTLRTWVMMLPIFAGVWAYSRATEILIVYNKWVHTNENTITTSLSDWLPDYVWYLFLFTGIILLRKSWHKISIIWKLSIWVLVFTAELFQYTL